MRWLALLTFVGCGPEVETVGQFSALTYNVQGLPDPLTDFDHTTAERMALIAPLLGHYDLVGLQEDFDAVNHGLLVDPAPHPIREWFNAKVEPDRIYGSGLAVLAAHGERIDYFENHYEVCNGLLDGASDCLASKGFQVLRLAVGGEVIDVYNTHHEAGGGDDDEAARAAQVAQVLDHMEAVSGDAAILFMGDTNLRPSDPADAVLLDEYAAFGLVDACDATSCTEPDHIDRFLVRSGERITLESVGWSREAQFVDGDEDLSDHPAIAAVLEWSTER